MNRYLYKMRLLIVKRSLLLTYEEDQALGGECTFFFMSAYY